MKYSTFEDVIASFPHPILPPVQGDPDYQTFHATRKFLQANSRAIDTHLGGGTLGHLGLIISDAAYAMISPTTAAGPTLWTSPQAPRRAPANTDGTAAQISAARHIWEEDVQTYRTCTSVQQALKKQIISERAIRTFKEHFVAGVSSVDPTFPLHLWDRLLPQAEITLNLLRTSRLHPQLSTATHFHGLVDYNKTAFAPPGCNIIEPKKPGK
jgi:hypothetical protein